MSKNYNEVLSCGRGAGTEKSYTVAFEPVLRLMPIEENINVFTDKAGVAIKYIPTGAKPLSGFVTYDELFGDISDRIAFANTKMYELELNPAAKAEAPYIFKMGNGFKGKSPEQCLLEGMPVEQLLSQRAYMEKNCTGKFAEMNRKGVEAIDRAILKFREGTLEGSVGSSTVFTIYDSGAKYFPKRGVAQPYQTEGWEMNIACSFLDDNPWKISWVSKQVTIQDNVIVAADQVITASAALTTGEFKAGINRAKRLFVNCSAIYSQYHIKFYGEHKDDWKAERGYT